MKYSSSTLLSLALTALPASYAYSCNSNPCATLYDAQYLMTALSNRGGETVTVGTNPTVLAANNADYSKATCFILGSAQQAQQSATSSYGDIAYGGQVILDNCANPGGDNAAGGNGYFLVTVVRSIPGFQS